MIGNPKMLRVWRVLKEVPHRWIDVMEVGKEANLTCRQVSALVNMLPMEVSKRYDKDNRAMQLKLDMSDEAIEGWDAVMHALCRHNRTANEEDIRNLAEKVQLIMVHTAAPFPDIDIQYKDRCIVIRKGVLRCQDVSDDI